MFKFIVNYLFLLEIANGTDQLYDLSNHIYISGRIFETLTR